MLITVTFISFSPSLKNGFIPTWDDNVYVTGNTMIRHLDAGSLKEMFTTTVNGTYVPLPLVFFAVEYALFGLNPLPYHLLSLLLHLLCTLAVFYFLRQMKVKSIYSVFGALLFAIHPMHVESVAWITELKDLLFGLFYLCSLIFYTRYIQAGEGKGKFMALSLACFVLSLFSKIQAVSLPLSLMLIDYFFERPFKLRLLLEKVPFFVLSLCFGIGGVLAIQSQGGLDFSGTFSLFQRVLLGLYALSAYIVKFLAPVHLSALYPFPAAGSSLPWIYYLTPLFLLLLGFMVYRSARYTRAVVFGSLFFVVNIMFVLQIVSVGTAFMADRFTYIPYLGFAFIAAWALEKAVNSKKGLTFRLASAVSIIALFFIFLTYDRCRIWLNGETLWTDVIEKYPGESSRPYSNRSVLYNEAGQWEKTISDCTRAISIDPNDAIAFSNRGVAFANIGEWDRAMSDCSRAIEINPEFGNAWSNRGNVFFGLKNWPKAVEDYTRAIAINPNDGNAWANRGIALGNLGDYNKAIEGLTKAIEIDPGNAKAYSNRGSVFVSHKELTKALADYTSAIALDPNYANAYFNRGTVYGDLAQWDKALADFSAAIKINPDMQAAYQNRDIAYRNVIGGK